MEACCRCQAERCYLWVKPKDWIRRKAEKWIIALDLCGWEAKGQGQKRVLPGCTEACHMHKIQGIALNADWSIGTKESSWIKLISDQQINYSETGGHVLTLFFLTCVKEGDVMKERLPIWKKPKDAQDQYWPIGCSRWARRIFHEDDDPHGLVIGRWRIADKSRREKEIWILRRLWWFGCNFLVLFKLGSLCLLGQVMCLP